jgi:hypothetical protein
VWNQPERGVYLWRVRAIHKERSVGVSDTLRFSVLDRQAIQILRPDAKARIQLSSHSALSFAWQKEVKSVTGGNRYRFVLGREAGLKTPNLNIEVKESSLEVKDFGWKQGTYFWKVELIQPNGDVVRASETQRFQVDTSPPLGAPILAIPRSGAIFNVVYHKEEPTLVWNPQEGAVDYLLEVSQSGKTVLQEKIPDIRWTLPRLKEGGYQWAVRAVDKFGRPGLQSQKRDFRIDYGPPLPAPSRVVTEVE